MKTIRFEHSADGELLDEAVRYELRREGLGTEFLDAVRHSTLIIAENPRAWQATEYGRQVRRFVMDRFPFSIIYTELADEILILAVAHSSREPGYWRR